MIEKSGGFARNHSGKRSRRVKLKSAMAKAPSPARKVRAGRAFSALLKQRDRKEKPSPESCRGWVLATSYSRTTFRRTTIGAAAFHCRVRNGNGWCHCATVTRVRCRTGGSPLRGEASRCRTLGTVIDDRWMVKRGVSFTIHLSLFTWERTGDSLISTYRLSDSAAN